MTLNRQILIFAQAMGQLSIVLATPILTRAFEPREIGQYQLAVTIGILLQAFFTLRYESVIPSEKSDALVAQYIRHALIASASIISILLATALIGVIFWTYDIAVFIGMILMVSVSYSLTAVDNSVLIRRKEMRRLGVRNLLTGTSVASLQIAAAFQLQSIIWVAFAIFAGRVFAVAVTWNYRNIPAISAFRLENDSFDFGRTSYRVAAHLVTSLSLSAMVLYSQVGFGAAATAFVGMAQRSASAPLGLISQALTQIVQATIGEEVRRGDTQLLRHVHIQMRSLLPFAALVALGLIILGPTLAVPVFGEGWEITGQLIAILGVPAGLQLLISPVSSVFYMLGADKRLFWIQLYRLLFSVLFAVGSHALFGGIVCTVMGYSLGTCVGFILVYLSLKDTIRKSMK